MKYAPPAITDRRSLTDPVIVGVASSDTDTQLGLTWAPHEARSDTDRFAN